MGCQCTKNNTNNHFNIIHQKNFNIYQSSNQQYKLLYNKQSYNILHIRNVKEHSYYIICNLGFHLDFILLHNNHDVHNNNTYILDLYLYKYGKNIQYSITKKEYNKYIKTMDYLSEKFNNIT